MKKITSAVLIAAASLLFAVGCGEKGIEGKWVKTRIENPDGTVVKDFGGLDETYEISGDTGTYTCGDMKMDITVEEDDDGYYHIKLKGKLELTDHVEVDGDKMFYSVDDGKETSTFIFERK